MRQRPHEAGAEHRHGTESLSPLHERRVQAHRTDLEEIPDQGPATGSAYAVRCSGVAVLSGAIISWRDYLRSCGTDAGSQ